MNGVQKALYFIRNNSDFSFRTFRFGFFLFLIFLFYFVSIWREESIDGPCCGGVIKDSSVCSKGVLIGVFFNSPDPYEKIASGNKKFKPYFTLAKRLVEQLKVHSPNLKVSVVTDNPVLVSEVKSLDKIIPYSLPIKKKWGEKLQAVIPNSPYDWTLYLDSDSVICSDVSHVFDVLNYFDVGLVLDPSRKKYFVNSVVTNVEMPFTYGNDAVKSSFYHLGGFTIFRRSLSSGSRMSQFIEELRKKDIAYPDYHDMMVMMETLLSYSSVRFITLPTEYYYRNDGVQIPTFLERKVLMSHGSADCSRLNTILSPRLYDPVQGNIYYWKHDKSVVNDQLMAVSSVSSISKYDYASS